LNVPHISSVTIQLPTLDSFFDSFGITNGPTSRIDQPRPRFEPLDGFLVDKVACTFMEGTVDRDDVTLSKEFLMTAKHR